MVSFTVDLCLLTGQLLDCPEGQPIQVNWEKKTPRIRNKFKRDQFSRHWLAAGSASFRIWPVITSTLYDHFTHWIKAFIMPNAARSLTWQFTTQISFDPSLGLWDSPLKQQTFQNHRSPVLSAFRLIAEHTRLGSDPDKAQIRFANSRLWWGLMTSLTDLE